MNAASSLLGVVAIPLAGLAWELFPGALIHKLFNVGTFNPGTWVAAYLSAVAINAGLETMVLRYAFKQPSVRRTFWWLCLANGISVAFAFASLFIYRIDHP